MIQQISSARFLRDLLTTILIDESIELHQIWGRHKPIIGAHNACFPFQIRCCLSKPERIKGNRGHKLKPNFRLFNPVI